MNLSELKTLAKQLGGVVVMNGNNPELVILSYGQFQRLNGPAASAAESGAALPPDTQEIERLNREILSLKEEIRQREEAELLAEANEDNRETLASLNATETVEL